MFRAGSKSKTVLFPSSSSEETPSPPKRTKKSAKPAAKKKKGKAKPKAKRPSADVPVLKPPFQQQDLLDSVYLHACLKTKDPNTGQIVAVSKSTLVEECNKEILRYAAMKPKQCAKRADKFRHALLIFRGEDPIQREEVMNASTGHRLRYLWVNLLREKVKEMVRKAPSRPRIDPDSVVGKFMANQRRQKMQAEPSHPGGDSDSCPELVDASSSGSSSEDDTSDSEDEDRSRNRQPVKPPPGKKLSYDPDTRDNVRRIRKG